MTTDSIAGQLERLGILDAREEPDPVWYRVLRFVCIWLYLMLFCAGAALLLTHMARPASASVSAPPAAAVGCGATACAAAASAWRSGRWTAAAAPTALRPCWC